MIKILMTDKVDYWTVKKCIQMAISKYFHQSQYPETILYLQLMK